MKILLLENTIFGIQKGTKCQLSGREKTETPGKRSKHNTNTMVQHFERHVDTYDTNVPLFKHFIARKPQFCGPKYQLSGRKSTEIPRKRSKPKINTMVQIFGTHRNTFHMGVPSFENCCCQNPIFGAQKGSKYQLSGRKL